MKQQTIKTTNNQNNKQSKQTIKTNNNYMKYTMKYTFSIIFLLLAVMTHAQAPQAIPYQAEARNSSGAILASTPITLRFTIRNSTSTGSILYRETQSVTTTANGMFNVNIGQGTPVSGTFASINWGTNAKFLQVELDPAGGSSYINMGTQQMMSVPYALYSNNGVPAGISGDILYNNGTNWVKLPAGTEGQVLTMSSGTPVWKNVPPTLVIGGTYGGGIIAYILREMDPGYVAHETHGLIAAPYDLGTDIQWGCVGTLVGTTAGTLGAGYGNTVFISGVCGAGTAARLCNDLVLGGYSDWHLPTTTEFTILYKYRDFIGGFGTGATVDYWTSTEYDNNRAWIFRYHLGSTSISLKNYPARVRAVRSF